MPAPSSTYRVQLHSGFTFRDLQRIIPYLHALGVDTVYASPITQATPGSMHGYDVTDPDKVNPELGDIEDVRAVIRDLRKHGMCWLQDIVPNHMAFHPMNARLMDVLERGKDSPYYEYFDIDWDHPDEDISGKLMIPFLGDDIHACLASHQIQLSFGGGGFCVNYLDKAYPLSLPAYLFLAEVAETLDEDSVLPSILRNMPSAATGDIDLATWQEAKAGYILAVDQLPDGVVQRMLRFVNDDPAQVSAMLDRQYYRLCSWKETDRRINYRRFFTVNELICLRMENKMVFDDYHATLLAMFKDKLVDGFRIDHIDGLNDPARYTQMLRSCVDSTTYIIAEKILEAREDMPTQWPVQGTSGYEFLSLLSQLLTNRSGARKLLHFYKEIVPDMPAYRTLIFDNKRLILETYLQGEWDNLVRLFLSSGLSNDFNEGRIKAAIGLFMLSLPVYRIYPDALPLKGKSLETIHGTLDSALKKGSAYAPELSCLRQLFTAAPSDQLQHDRILAFLRRLMQFTGPLTAKGVEDTTFYVYNPLISHDEVGDSPDPLGMTVQRFHEKMQMRLSTTPLSLNATATHDTKRGEDARLRINVLSRIPDEWIGHTLEWLEMNQRFRSRIGGKEAPSINDEYFVYQALLGGFPHDFIVTDEWIGRVQAYLVKALREAKIHSNWSSPDEAYEKACEQFIGNILDPGHTFLNSFVPFVKSVCQYSSVSSLTQTLIKLTAPGIPDVYQGCELWDLSFVDPDNRRPVDYSRRMELLFQLVMKEGKGVDAVFEYLRQNRDEGAEKLYLIWKVLNFRRANSLLFAEGDYLPLAVTGQKIEAAAYARRKEDTWVIAVFPFGLAEHDDPDRQQFVILPEEAPEHWYNLFTGESLDGGNQLALIDVLRNFPVALLTSGV